MSPQGGMLPPGMDVPMPRPRPPEAPQMPQQQPQMTGADAMAQAPQQFQQPQQQPQQPQGPNLLQRLSNSDGVIGGMANFIGGITGQSQRGINPETSTGPAGQAYRLMLSKGVDPATAKLMASSKEMATAWMQKNIANDQYQTIAGPDGKPIAQKNISTGKIEADPRFRESYEPVLGPNGQVIGQRNTATGQRSADPTVPDTFEPVYSATGQLVGQRSTRTGKIESDPQVKDNFEPVLGPNGQVIGQRNTMTGERRSDPTITDSFEPVKDDANRIVGQRNVRSGKVEADPRFKTDDLSIQTEERQRAAQAQGLKPGSPAYLSYVLTGKMPREDQQLLTATDKKAIMEADEAVLSAQTAVEALGRAKQLSKEAYAGPMAGQRGYVTSLFGDKAGEATTDLNNQVTTNALGQLKAIFGGNPTEGERKILLDIQGSANQPDAVRQKIYDRAIALAQRRWNSTSSVPTNCAAGRSIRPRTAPRLLAPPLRLSRRRLPASTWCSNARRGQS
jgi:hypothetical protein